jgi:hypothetical protein
MPTRSGRASSRSGVTRSFRTYEPTGVRGRRFLKREEQKGLRAIPSPAWSFVHPIGHKKPRIGPVTRSFSGSLDLLRLGGHDGGIQTLHRARHLFPEHCRATPDTMVHLRMSAEESHRGVVRQGSGACQQLPGWRDSPRVSGRLLSSSPVRGRPNGPKENLLVMPPIGINAPFTPSAK